MTRVIKRIRLGQKIFYPPPLKEFIFYILKKIFINRGIPYMGIIGLTYRCPAKCGHCMTGVDKQADKHLELSKEEIFEVLDIFKKIGVIRILLFGGEPFIRDDIVNIIEYADSLNFVVAVDSNGFYITYDLVERLRRNKRLEIAISLDSNISEEHDGNRQCKGLFAHAVQSIRLLVDAKIKVIVSTYVSRQRLNDGVVERVVCLARKLGVRGVRLLLPICSGRWFSSCKEVFSLEERILLRNKFDPGFVFLSDPYSFILERFPSCSALSRNLIYVSPSGYVQPCCALPLSFGNIRTEPLIDIVKNMCRDGIMGKTYNDCPMNDEKFRRGFPADYSPLSGVPLDISSFSTAEDTVV